MINSRPLVYIDDDINSSVTLSPTDFLSLHSNNVIPDVVEEIGNLISQEPALQNSC